MSISLLALKNLKSYYSYFIEIDRKERQLVNSYKKCRRGIGYCIYLHCLSLLQLCIIMKKGVFDEKIEDDKKFKW